jgi:hypothetical protein
MSSSQTAARYVKLIVIHLVCSLIVFLFSPLQLPVEAVYDEEGKEVPLRAEL